MELIDIKRKLPSGGFSFAPMPPTQISSNPLRSLP